MTSESEIKERAELAHGCLDWLDICDAECCRSFALRLSQNLVLKKGQSITFTVPLDKVIKKDYATYYTLHGAKQLADNVFQISLENFRVSDDLLIIEKRCELLSSDLTCLGENYKPKVCREFTQETAFSKDYVCPKYCLFKIKQEMRNNANAQMA